MSLLGRRPIRASHAYLWFDGSWSLLHAVSFTLLLVYQVQTADLTPLQLVLVGTVMEATCFLAEVPTGIVADLYSRRLSMLIGAVVVGVGIGVQGVFPAFVPILIGNVIWAIGYTFLSGAGEAWISDEVEPDGVQPVFTRAEQINLGVGVGGTLLAGALGLLDLRLPMIIAGCSYIALALIMAPLMPETGFTPTPRNERESFRHLRRLMVEGLTAARRRGVVRSFLIIALLTGISSEVFDRLWTAHLLQTFRLPSLAGVNEAALWFTAFALAGRLIALISSLAANRFAAERINARHPAGVMALLILIQLAGVIGFAVSGSLWLALGAMWLRTAAQTVAAPIRSAWLARNVSSTSRATTLSFANQADAIGQVIGGPPLGALATRTSIPVALIVSAILFGPAAVVSARLRPNVDERRRPVTRQQS
ncbi:MFS transporter [Microlunatus soli]|uniref:MFS transporter, DHA3 family, tetracycline resistance protein n=1 Tax=Microlunatus soli TaxID=630515 RepID=A0A1H1V4D0_9ACTN|nr:MFS transporter [Microlunatus soli]SDS79553.1 MFS transporter, DHA3 family, tetracycline resistance protein [Microlunatus soli]